MPVTPPAADPPSPRSRCRCGRKTQSCRSDPEGRSCPLGRSAPPSRSARSVLSVPAFSIGSAGSLFSCFVRSVSVMSHRSCRSTLADAGGHGPTGERSTLEVVRSALAGRWFPPGQARSRARCLGVSVTADGDRRLRSNCTSPTATSWPRHEMTGTDRNWPRPPLSPGT